jgi:DNA ligase-1
LEKVRWVEPKIVCEVKFMELTEDLKLRAPSFQRLREDKLPEECFLEV